LQKITQSPDKLPEIDELDTFLREQLPVKIPLSPVDFSHICIVDPSNLKGNNSINYFIESTKGECRALYLNLLVRLISPARYSSNEDSFHGFWDDTIRRSFETFGQFVEGLSSMNIDRNTNEHTTTGKILSD
jgi:hypothetical protein